VISAHQRHRQTDRQTDGRTDVIRWQYRSVKTIKVKRKIGTTTIFSDTYVTMIKKCVIYPTVNWCTDTMKIVVAVSVVFCVIVIVIVMGVVIVVCTCVRWDETIKYKTYTPVTELHDQFSSRLSSNATKKVLSALYTICHSGVIEILSDLRSPSAWFHSQPFHYQLTTMGKLFTHAHVAIRRETLSQCDMLRNGCNFYKKYFWLWPI